MKCFTHSDGCCSPITDCCCLQTVRQHRKEQSLLLTETLLSNQESTTDWSGSIVQSWLVDVLMSASLRLKQKSDLKIWLQELPYKEYLVIAEASQKATLDVIMAAYARDCLSKENIGPQSQLEKDSQSPITASTEDVQEEKIGVIKYPEDNRGKTINQLTDSQLKTEWLYWTQKVASAKNCGASVGAAAKFKQNCESEMIRRKITDPVPLMNKYPDDKLRLTP